MRKIAANIIYPVSSAPIKNGYLVLDNNGTMLDVVDTNNEIKEIAGLEYYSGILIPGMVLTVANNNKVVNLSNLTDNFNAEQLKWARYMYSRGIQAVGCDTVFSVLAKTQTFIDYLIKLSQADLSFELSLNQLTLQNAQMLDLHEQMGSFEPGKQPGVILFTGFDYETQSPGLSSSVKRLI